VHTHKVVNVVDPAANQDAATKKYVDDSISAAQDASYTGGESHTFPGGMIIKNGYSARTGTGAQAVVFAVPFPTAIVSVTLGPYHAGANIKDSLTVGAVAKSGFTHYSSESGYEGTYWMAIGY
jgi:hypothetical protein